LGSFGQRRKLEGGTRGVDPLLVPTGLHYREHFGEAGPDDTANRIASPPISIAQPPEPTRQTVFDPSKPEDVAAMRASMFEVPISPYPEVWPFEGPVAAPPGA
jgi:hypothetical protein